MQLKMKEFAQYEHAYTQKETRKKIAKDIVTFYFSFNLIPKPFLNMKDFFFILLEFEG